jgi:hypothetical protein
MELELMKLDIPDIKEKQYDLIYGIRNTIQDKTDISIIYDLFNF